MTRAAKSSRASSAQAKSAPKSGAFKAAMKDAATYARDPVRLRALIDEAVKKARRMPKGPFKDLWPYFLAMLRLLRAYYAGSYRKVPWQTVLMLVAAVIYVVNPLDFIPDAIFGIGLLDDATVVGFVVRSVKAQIDAFMDWETTKD